MAKEISLLAKLRALVRILLGVWLLLPIKLKGLLTKKVEEDPYGMTSVKSQVELEMAILVRLLMIFITSTKKTSR